MKKYCLYEIWYNGEVSGPPKVLECQNDEMVMKEAERLVNGQSISIWEDERFVGHLSPHSVG